MQVLHETEQPDSGVADGLLESSPGRSLLLDIDSVSKKSVVRELLLLVIQPLGGERGVGQEGPGAQSDETSDGSLDDEEPSPPGHTLSTIELEDTSGDQTSKGSGKNVSCQGQRARVKLNMAPPLTSVQDSNSGRNFCSGVKIRNDVDRSGIAGGRQYWIFALRAMELRTRGLQPRRGRTITISQRLVRSKQAKNLLWLREDPCSSW